MDKSHKILENTYGIKVATGFVVHHKDGNHKNNELENLVVLTISGHRKWHQNVDRYPEDMKTYVDGVRARYSDPDRMLKYRESVGKNKLGVSSVKQCKNGSFEVQFGSPQQYCGTYQTLEIAQAVSQILHEKFKKPMLHGSEETPDLKRLKKAVMTSKKFQGILKNLQK